MAKVKCDYCSAYIQDTDEKCPYCGAVNSHLQRTAHDTPHTIEELQDWYKARKLPPEQTTRFFIGKDIKEPKAFGIYFDGYTYVVYKNKANGERAVRYQGTDEAYAVNELYLKLKEVILIQKDHNIQRRKNNSRKSKRYRGNRRALSFLRLFITLILFLPTILAVGSFIVSEIQAIFLPKTYSYYLSDDRQQLYYCSNTVYPSDIEWWQYDLQKDEWSFYGNLSNKIFPEGVTYKSRRDVATELPDLLGKTYEQLYIYHSRTYIDSGHHCEPSSAYYEYDGHLYYFLYDCYGSTYGTRNNTGWYLWNEDEWEYYADFEDKETIGEELYYVPDQYQVGTNFYDFDKSEEWHIENFSNTDWYQDYDHARQEYDKVVAEERANRSNDNRWDNDDDWDWDYDDDWDYDYGDWDSDW